MNRLKEYIRPLYEYIKTYLCPKKVDLEIDNKKKTVYIFLSPDYPNLGDVAIYYAQRKFIEENYPTCNIIEIPISKTYDYIKSIKKVMKSSDIITLIGGGNFGDLYPIADYARLFIIKTFKNNKIIAFPQSFGFSNTPYGKRRLQKTKKVIEKNQNVILFARENKSFDLMKENFLNTKIKLCPDIVLSLDKSKQNERKNITFALRNDAEKSLEKEQEEKLIKYFKEKYENILFQDTTMPINEFKEQEKFKYLEKVIEVFSTSRLVITDRLHGMIFCYITKTPCIVFSNNNHKIISTYYTWLKNCNFIKFSSNISLTSIEALTEELLNLKKIERIELKEKYDCLEKTLK